MGRWLNSQRFHRTFGIYADGVSLKTARFPEGWPRRLVPYQNENTRGVTGYCLDPADLLVTKYLAHREKDLAFCEAVVRAGLVDVRTVATRIPTAPGTAEEHQTALARLQRHASKRHRSPPSLSR